MLRVRNNIGHRDGHNAMVRYRRNHLPGGTYFFTVTLANRRSTALVDRVHDLRAAFRATMATAPFSIDAIVVLPEHLHAILSLPHDDADYPNRWRRIKSHFTSAVIAEGSPLVPDPRGEYRIWQHRYWEHTIRDEDDFARHVDYIHINPVKHGLVTHVADWPYSSFHRYVRHSHLPRDWAGTVPMASQGYGEPAP
jgi:putative transposase